jgi:lysophospholipase L1-like esterase
VSEPGDFTGRDSFTPARTITAWYWLSGVDVQRPRGRTIVAFGDSITEGYGSTTDQNCRWPDFLTRRLIAAGDSHAVIDMGIGGNRVLNDEIGPNALSRLDADLLTQAGVDTVILLEATNDIGIPIGGKDWLPPNVALTVVSAEEIIAGYQQIIRRAHGAGIRIFGATLAPWGKSTYDTADNETKRQTVNDWIRTSGAFDAVIDFDAAVRDSQTPTQLEAAFDSGDHLHPNDAGYSAMAQAIDLRLFRRYQLRTIGR